ncbi:hypothetical protein BDR04DRAFT_780682 [Suillus decipiens]|nr:hypothetical protein BDR04DRAFT_780682 [Suillus decipiens]
MCLSWHQCLCILHCWTHPSVVSAKLLCSVHPPIFLLLLVPQRLERLILWYSVVRLPTYILFHPPTLSRHLDKIMIHQATACIDEATVSASRVPARS